MARKPKPTAETMIPAIKGFDRNLQCLGFQFEAGQTYRHNGEVKCCQGGFHAITDHPLEVFAYYPPASSRFCRVTLSGATHSDDKIKTAAEIITIGQEIGLGDLANEAVKWVLARATLEGPIARKANGLATASGYQGAATASGYQGAATASGYQGAATASGYQGAATASGDQGAATASGSQGQVKGALGNALFACERETWNGPILSVACGIVGQDDLKPDTRYRAVSGKLVEVV